MKKIFKILSVLLVLTIGYTAFIPTYNDWYIEYQIETVLEKIRPEYSLQQLDKFEFQTSIVEMDSSIRVYTYRVDTNSMKKSIAAFIEKRVDVQYDFFFWKGKVLAEMDVYENKIGEEAQYLSNIHFWIDNESCGLLDFHDTIYYEKEGEMDTVLWDNSVWIDLPEIDSILNMWNIKTPHNT